MKPFTTLAIAVFFIVAIAHLLRLLLGFDVIIGGYAVPTWASLVGAIFAGMMALMLARESRRKA